MSATNDELERQVADLRDRIIFLEGAVTALRDKLLDGERPIDCAKCGAGDVRNCTCEIDDYADDLNALADGGGLSPAERSTNDDETIERLRGDR